MMVPGCFGEEATKRTGFQSHSRVGNEPWKAQGATEVLQRPIPLVPAFEGQLSHSPLPPRHPLSGET